LHISHVSARPLSQPKATKDGGTLRTISDAITYMHRAAKAPRAEAGLAARM
jgi:hypothetical protein